MNWIMCESGIENKTVKTLLPFFLSGKGQRDRPQHGELGLDRTYDSH